jgi:molybdenum cofactor guanylyltransferase
MLYLPYPLAWLVLACDMPDVASETVEILVERRNPTRAATSYFASMIEPFFTIWEPEALNYLESEVLQGRTSPRRALESLNCELVHGDAQVLKSINFPDENRAR